ncbi:MAG: ABC transporter permease [Lachnospiraceae bacterium]|nr:ABC transporter permease [Lachnospiraceae bacterium]
MKTMVWTTLKLLVRMKSFWFFLIMTPVLSTVVLKTNENSLSYYENSQTGIIAELDSPDEKVAYYGGKGKCVLKVYNAAGSEASEYMIEKISGSGLFQVCRVDISKKNSEDLAGFMDERVKLDGENDRMGAALFISPDFDNCLTGRNIKEAIKIFVLSDDSRIDALENEIRTQFARFESAADDGLAVKDMLLCLKEMDKAIPRSEIVSFSAENKIKLTGVQIDQKTRMGYALAILTLGYVFCGLFIAHIAINEQKDSVLTRIKLTGKGIGSYFASKFIAVFCVTLMITAVMAVCSLFIDVDSIGIGRMEFLAIISMMGLIFSTLNMLLGMLIGDVMTSNVAAFTVWSMSGLLSGLYFPLSYTTDAIKTISYMMPHKWFLDGTEMILTGDKTGLFVLLCVTVAFLVIIGSLGGLGLRVKRTDEWGNV